MRERFLKEVAGLGLPGSPGPQSVISESDIARLPDTAQRYLRFMGVVGRPRDWSFRMEFAGRFRAKVDGPWAACRTWQYNTRLDLARVFHIRMRFGGVIPVLARDTYRHGHGRMLGKVLDLFTVVDGKGPEFDIGELVTYLNDAIFWAPSMILGLEATWTPVNGDSFDVTLNDHWHRVTARVFVDERGAPTDFSTTDRFLYDPQHPKRLLRAKWTTPSVLEFAGRRPVSGWGQAIWHLPEGPKPYADFTLVPGSLVYNVPPGD
jgi:hypothetical protein